MVSVMHLIIGNKLYSSWSLRLWNANSRERGSLWQAIGRD